MQIKENPQMHSTKSLKSTFENVPHQELLKNARAIFLGWKNTVLSQKVNLLKRQKLKSQKTHDYFLYNKKLEEGKNKDLGASVGMDYV